MPVFNCPKCNKEFTEKANLTRHLARKFPCDAVAETEHKCPDCEQEFTSPFNLQRHIQRRHSGTPLDSHEIDVEEVEEISPAAATPVAAPEDSFELEGNRIRKTMETPQRVSVYDLIVASTCDTNPRSTFLTLKETFRDIAEGCSVYKFPGRGNMRTPVTDARGAVAVMNRLPGHGAARFRLTHADTIIQHLGGINGDPIDNEEDVPDVVDGEAAETAIAAAGTEQLAADQFRGGVQEASNAVVVASPSPPSTGCGLVDALVGDRVVTEMRASDGFVNATKMCKAGGKDMHDYLRLDSTSAFRDALSLEPGYLGLELVSTKRGGRHSGTWVHPKVAIHLAMWISPAFAVAVTDLVERFLGGQVTTGESQQAAAIVSGPQFHETSSLELQSITNLIDMRAPQVYARQVQGKWSNVHPVGRPQDVLSEEELRQFTVTKIGCMGLCTGRQYTHDLTLPQSKLIDSMPTLAYSHVEMMAKDEWKNNGELYEGQHENKQIRDKELLLARTQEDYERQISVMIRLAAASNEPKASVELLLEQEKTKQTEAEARKAEAEAVSRKAEAEAVGRKADAEAIGAQEKTKQKLVDLDMMRLQLELRRLGEPPLA